MENIDLTTASGCAAAVIIAIEAIKKLADNVIDKMHPWYPSILNLTTLIVSGFIGALSWIVLDVPYPEWILNSLIAFFLAIGGYEPLVNLLRGFTKKPL